jgi:hypothetical protein
VARVQAAWPTFAQSRDEAAQQHRYDTLIGGLANNSSIFPGQQKLNNIGKVVTERQIGMLIL